MAPASSIVHELAVAGMRRSYRLFVPPALGSVRGPLMIVLHGGLGNAEIMEKQTGMNAIALRHGFLVAYPNGSAAGFGLLQNRRTWNAGRCCGPASRRNVDDVQFIDRMIDDIGQKHPVDSARIYVTGMSNGAMLAYRLVCELPSRFAAAVAVAGTLAVDECRGGQDIPILHIHGALDRHVPFAGGVGEDSLAQVSHRSVPETLRLLTESRHCVVPPRSKILPGGDEEITYDCGNHAPVVLRIVAQGGHVWPGGGGRRNQAIYGGDFSASELVWEFASRYAKSANVNEPSR